VRSGNVKGGKGKDIFNGEKLRNGLIEIEDIKLGNGKDGIIDSGKWDTERWKRERICLWRRNLKMV
jgi:hypothetical protein